MKYMNQKGSVLLLMVITIPFLFALSALAVDIGALYSQRAHMQNIADAAALAGASQLVIGQAEAEEMAEVYVARNSTRADAGHTVAVTFPSGNERIRVEISQAVPLIFMRYFNYMNLDLAVHAVASYSDSSASIFDYSIISGGEETFYLLGEWGSGGNQFNAPIHVNGRFQFDKNSEAGHGTDNIPGSGNQINSPITISAPQYEIGGLNKPANQVLAPKFSYGAEALDITEANPVIKAKIDLLTNKSNTFSDSHPANQWGSIDASKLTSPLYVEGNLGSGYNAKNFVSGTYTNDVVIVAIGDISLNFSAATFSNTATVTLISLTGKIMISGGNVINLNALAPHGSVTINGGGTTINGYLIGQSITLGQGNRTYQNSRGGTGGGTGGGSTTGIRLIE
jgi:hypothetical protein